MAPLDPRQLGELDAGAQPEEPAEMLAQRLLRQNGRQAVLQAPALTKSLLSSSPAPLLSQQLPSATPPPADFTYSYERFSSSDAARGGKHGISPTSAIASWRHLSTASGPVTQDVEEFLEDAELAQSMPEINSRDLVIKRTSNPRPLPELSQLKFGAAYSDHMLTVAWSQDRGWSRPAIDPLAPLPIHPAAQVLHYAMECFEGMKAYKGPDGKIRMFRPDRNMARLAGSCERLNLPAFDKVEFLECLKALLREEREWIPQKEGFSIYLRPTCIATTPSLGVGPPTDALLFCLLSPVGPYFPEGLKPVRLFVDTKNVRAFPGGLGDKKVGGNYGPTILPQVNAAAKGCSQVLYALEDGKAGGALVGECGAMNMFFLFKNEKVKGGMELVTPPLDGLILPGVTRDSVLGLIRSWGEFEVSERALRLDEVEEANSQGRIVEIFGSGTAVVIQPVSDLLLPSGKELKVPYDHSATLHWSTKAPGSSAEKPQPDEPFSLAGRVYRSLLDIQYGHVEHEWSVVID